MCSPNSTPRRRDRLAEMVRDAEQVLVTAAVAEDIPRYAFREPVHRGLRAGAT